MAISDDQRQRLIVAQNAATAAATVYSAIVEADPSTGWDHSLYEVIRSDIFGESMALAGEAVTTEQAVSNVVTAFPGAKVQQTAPGDLGPLKVLKPMDGNHPDWLLSQWEALVEAGKVDETDVELWDNRKFLQRFGGKSKNTAAWYKSSKGEVAIWPPKGHSDYGDPS